MQGRALLGSRGKAPGLAFLCGLVCLFIAASVAAQGVRAKKVVGPAWRVVLTQIDKSNTMVGEPHGYDCAPTGCEELLVLDVEGRPYRFLVALTFVPKGAYFALQSMQPEVRKVIEFEKGFEGPLFLQVRPDSRFSTMLRFTLVGAALSESEATTPQLMPNSSSLVFHRKLVPDMTLRVDIDPVAPKVVAPPAG